MKRQAAALALERWRASLTRRHHRGPVHTLRSQPQVKLLDQIVVVELFRRAAFDGDPAVHDYVAAVGDADGLREILLRHQYGELELVLELFDRIDGAANQQRRQA